MNRNVVESAHDRLLDGSVLAIAERLTVDEDNEVTVDLSAVPREALAPAVALNALLERLEQSIGTVRRFTADASHQMRTPLTILSTHLGIFQRRGIDTPEARAALEDIEAATTRLERLLAPLIALARADEGGSAGDETEYVDLARVAATVIAERVPQALAAGTDIQFEGPENPVPIAANEVLTGEIVANLLDNAIRYSRQGEAVIVRVAAAEIGGRLEVEDEGSGIPAADRARVLERFYRIPRKGGPEGSGVGLAYCPSVGRPAGGRYPVARPELWNRTVSRCPFPWCCRRGNPGWIPGLE